MHTSDVNTNGTRSVDFPVHFQRAQMASRDLTNFFMQSRSLFHRPKVSNAGGGGDGGGKLLGASGDASMDTSSRTLCGVLPEYVATFNELQADLTSITARREWRPSARVPPGPQSCFCRPLSLPSPRLPPHPTPTRAPGSGEHDAPVRPARKNCL